MSQKQIRLSVPELIKYNGVASNDETEASWWASKLKTQVPVIMSHTQTWPTWHPLIAVEGEH